MTVETKLRSAMADAVAPASPDTDRLVSLARRRGMGIRRRRQALGTIGVAAALGLAVLAPSVIAGDRGSKPDDGVLVGTQPKSFDLSQTTPIDGRSTAAALVYAVGLQAHGKATDFVGQGDGADGVRMTFGRFDFTPDSSTAAGEVGVNVQYAPPKTQAKGVKARHLRCDSYMEQCELTQLADGSVLRTSAQRSTYGSRTGLMRVADLHRPDGLRVVAFASNGLDISERDEQVTREDPVLTTEQLVAVVTQPWWGVRIPEYFTRAGNELDPYNSVGGAAATPTSAPTK
jgi:hypothetical protein